MKSSAS